MSMFDIFTERYRTGDLPWDHELPPPEIIAFAEANPPGRALDLGCGLGRAGVYLAQRGWQYDGVDFIAEAVAQAKERARAAGVAERTRFYCASVAQLDFLQPPYDLAIDVGCIHNLRGADLSGCAAEVARLVGPNGMYLLFARIAERDDAPRGIPEATVQALFAPHFAIERVEHGESPFGGEIAPSAWFWLRKL